LIGGIETDRIVRRPRTGGELIPLQRESLRVSARRRLLHEDLHARVGGRPGDAQGDRSDMPGIALQENNRLARMPAGFAYRAELISREHEKELLVHLADLQFEPFQFHGYEGKRRAISYGWEYDFNEREFRQAEPIPAFLSAARQAAAEFAGPTPADLQHALVLEYPTTAAIGWHMDKPHFGDVVGISLLSPCTLRFRRRGGTRWERASIVAEPRSAYLLRGPSRTEWEHSIPAVDQRRYSITFRTLATDGAAPVHS
jgi:alkylated DNA repair dioxygenase AlkB